MGIELVNHPEVVAVIRGVLVTGGIRNEVDLKQSIGDVQHDAIERYRAGDPPREDTVEGWKPYIRDQTRKYLAKKIRKAVADRKYTVPLSDAEGYVGPAPSSADPDPIDMKRAYEEYNRQAEAGKLGKRAPQIFDGIQAETPQGEIASELGVGVQTVRNEASRARARFMKRMTAVGLAGLFAAGVVVFVILQYRGPKEEAQHDKPTPPAPSLIPSQAPPQLTPDQKEALALRTKARQEMAQQQWDQAREDFDKARDLDPIESSDDQLAYLTTLKAIYGDDLRGMDAKHWDGGPGQRAPKGTH